jgi:hypothetical protein
MFFLSDHPTDDADKYLLRCSPLTHLATVPATVGGATLADKVVHG